MAKTVFTNGCFDLIHPGHIDLLRRAKALGERLIVGLNSDESVRRMKGGGRPFMDQRSRKDVLLGLDMVDEVIIFDELTPAKLISEILPDVLVKGGDWPIDQIVGADVEVEESYFFFFALALVFAPDLATFAVFFFAAIVSTSPNSGMHKVLRRFSKL